MKITGPVWALGAMSGTSLDGVDAAFVKTDGQTISAFGPSEYRAYSDTERATLKSALGQWQDGPDVPAASELCETAHASLLSRLLQSNQEHHAQLIGFHGQTLAHDPKGRGTHQAGDGALLAEVLNCPVVWDFRSADVQLGGQGAPFAPFFHFACAKYLNLSEPTAFLNLGGVGNVTFVDPGCTKPEDDGALLAFDTGPANAPINDLMQARQGKPYDHDGATAASGIANTEIVEKFLTAAYFHKMPPKSLDRDDFLTLEDQLVGMSDADAAATLAECCAASVARAMEHSPMPVRRILVCGGGRKNQHIMARISALTGVQVDDVDLCGLDGDMLEAQAFAYLAVRVTCGLPTSCPSTTGVAANVGGGIVSEPS